MKKIILLVLLMAGLERAEAQRWSIGPKIEIGAGWITSNNLHDNLNAQLTTDNQIKQWKESVSPGVNFGLGVVVGCNLTEKLALMGELTWNTMNSQFNMEYSRNKVNAGGDGDITTSSSTALIKINYVSLPLLFKYSFSGDHGFYGLAGVKFNFLSTPTIESSETRTKDSYNNFILDNSKSSYESRSVSAKLNVFETTRTSLTLGLGYAFALGGKNLLVDLRYNLPLTKSPMYTTNQYFSDNAFENNAVFGLPGKMQYEANAYNYPLNDFKMSSLKLSIALILFNN